MHTTVNNKMSSRPRTAPTKRSSLESLIQQCLPSLAPRHRSSSALASGRSSATGSRPTSRIENGGTDDKDEKERKEQIKEVMAFCEEIMGSRIPSSAPLDISTLPDVARQLLAQESRDGMSDKALRFNSTWNKLDRGVSFDFIMEVSSETD